MEWRDNPWLEELLSLQMFHFDVLLTAQNSYRIWKDWTGGGHHSRWQSTKDGLGIFLDKIAPRESYFEFKGWQNNISGHGRESIVEKIGTV